MTRRCTFRSRGAATVAIAVHAAASIASAQSRSRDSAQAAALFRESAASARAAPANAPHRIDLLRRIAAAHVKVADDAGALQAAAALGAWQFEVRTDIACRLLEDRRFDEAYRLAASSPPAHRDWALAHLASQLAQPPFSPRRRHVDTVDTAALVRRAFAVARAVRMPEAKVDAYLSIGYTLRWRRHDTTGVVTATLAARSALGGVRDADFVRSRRVMIAGTLGATGRLDEAIPMLRSLPPRDRLTVVWYFGEGPAVRDPRVRAELQTIADLLPSIPKPNVRAEYAFHLYWALRYAGDSAQASAIYARYPGVDPSIGRAWAQDGSGRSLADDAESLARAEKLGAALAAVEQIPDPMRVGFRARAYLELADAAYGQNRDTIRLALRRASEVARTTSLGDTLRDRLLADIGGAQLSRGFHDDGLETLALVGSSEAAASALGEIGSPPTIALSTRDRYAIIRRASTPAVRAWATAELIERTSSQGNPSAEDGAWLTALADSLPPGIPREQAQIAVALHSLSHKDTSSARARLVALLPTHEPDLESPSFFRFTPPNDLIDVLVRIGATDEALQWARSLPDPLTRAAALLSVGEAVRVRGEVGKEMWISNGPDDCRQAF